VTDDISISTFGDSVKLYLTDGRMDGRTDGQTSGIEFGAFLFQNVTSGGNNFYDFPDNQLTKFRVFIG